MIETFKIKYSALSKIKRLPPRDQGHYLPFDTYPHGCPLGGFGAGTIGRSPYGDFNIWHIKVGAHIDEEVKGCTFHIYQRSGKKVLNNLLVAREYEEKEKLSRFAKPFSVKEGEYSASFPKAKYRFKNKKGGVHIECEQFSPILPHNYKDTSYPLAVFNYKLTNPTRKTIDVAIMLTWENMIGWGFKDQRPGVQDNWYSFIKKNDEQIHFVKTSKKAVGLVMTCNKKKIEKDMDGEISLATLTGKDRKVTFQKYFFTDGDGEELTVPFYNKGELEDKELSRKRRDQGFGTAIAVKIHLKPGETKEIPFVLAWDLPLSEFGRGIKKYKYYTKYFNKKGTNGWQLAQLGLTNYKKWSKDIDKWHESIIKKSRYADRFKDQNLHYYFQMLINELYFLSDGGSYWDAATGDFGLLECFDYPFYETLDVRFYGSFPLLKFWPEIELQIMRKFARTISMRNNKMQRFNSYGEDPKLKLPKNPKKRILYYDKKLMKGACPHDLGSPKKDPFKEINGYIWQNVNYWKDLNTKFVLLCYRNYKHTKDMKFLKSCWPAIKEAVSYLEKLDHDNDGIPENSGYPDQTYDNWIMHGVSAYCGTLWLAALRAIVEMSKNINDEKTRLKYEKLYDKAYAVFEKKLWNGKYYNFDEKSDDIMTDQLIGDWYFAALGECSIFSESRVESVLRTIYKFNFRRMKRGKWGLISGKKKK